jgi:hypothetical protein
MQKKYQNLFWIISGIFLCTIIFSLPNKTQALSLEIDYPTINGQSVGIGSTIEQYYLYLFNLGMFVGFFSVFISLIIAGATYLMAPFNPELRASAKDRVSGAISGLLIFATLYLIIVTINPQLAIIRMNDLPSTPSGPENKKPGGVYFNLSNNCSDPEAKIYTTNVEDLGNKLRNQVYSVGIVHDPEIQSYFISVLYENPGFRGRCQYISPNRPCTPVQNFASSASVYQYNFWPNGDGVYFYRKANFDKGGGYYKVSNYDIVQGRGVFIGLLDNMKFQNVPENDQDCQKYEKNGECSKGARVPQSLSGENISSVEIKGNYFVLFVYISPKDSPNGIWTSCQGFPTPSDINKTGPRQIKWENVRNHNGVVPNYVVILPVIQK